MKTLSYFAHRIAVSVSILALSAGPSIALAEESTASPTEKPIPSLRGEIREERQEKRQDIREHVAEKREEVKANIEERRAQFKEKLAGIRDERKRGIVERVDVMLGALNERLANHFTVVLERLQAILDRITAKADLAQDRGVDVSDVRDAIAAAQTAIDAAEAAVADQADNSYPITITDETSLRADVTTARQALRADITAVHALIQAAREAVRGAATALTAAIGSAVASSTPTLTPTP